VRFWYFIIVTITGGYMKRIKKLIVVMCTAFFLYGCPAVAILGIGAAGGIGGYKYYEGRLAREYPLSYARAWRAVNTALTNLQISISSSMDDKVKGTIDAVRRDGKKVTVTLKDRGQGVTSIAVRVGLLGDRYAAQRIHEEIASVSGIK
jgi:hypothetical protein